MKKISLLVIILISSVNCLKNSSDFHGLSKSQVQKIFRSIETDSPSKNRNLHADHYPSSNERRIDLFRPYLQNLGGGYIGVGTDQNFSFIAWAKSEFVWLVDFDEVSVAVNKIHMYFISISPTAKDFRKLWSRKERKNSFKLVEKHFKPKTKNIKSINNYKNILAAWKVAHRGEYDVPSRFIDLDYMIKHFKLSTFVNNKSDYDYIKMLIQKKRIIALHGDLTKNKTIQSIAIAAKKMKLPIRVFYMSNAEEYFRFPKNFRNNILALPTDKKGYIVRTSSVGSELWFGYPVGEKFPEAPLHYTLQSMENMKTWMKFQAPLKIVTVLRARTEIEKGFSFIKKTPLEAGLKIKGKIK